MHLPMGSELEQLIRAPVEYLQCYQAFEKAQRLPELLSALSELPFSKLREARRARVMYRLGQIDKAMVLLEGHLDHRLCMAWHVVFQVVQGGNLELRKLLVRYPTTWPINADPINMEAKARLHLARGVAFITLNMPEAAQREFSEAIRFSELLGDQMTQNIALMEFARGDLFNNRLEQALSAYRQVVRDVPAHTMVSHYSLVYATHIHWLLGLPSRWLVPWSAYALETLRLKRPAGTVPEVPANVSLLELGEVLEKLSSLAQVFYQQPTQWPQLRQERPHLQHLEHICQQATDLPSDEISSFFMQVAHALVLSMQADSRAFEVASRLTASPGFGITHLAFVHAALHLQLEANLSQAGHATASDAHWSLLSRLWEEAETGTQRWMMWWMERFTPAVLQGPALLNVPMFRSRPDEGFPWKP